MAFEKAAAKDSTRLVCLGFGKLEDDEKMGISIDFYEARHQGSKRRYELSTIYQSRLFQARGVQGDAADSVLWGGPITLANPGSGRKLFVGAFEVSDIEKKETDRGGDADFAFSYTMVLKGKISDDPTSKTKLQPVTVTLSCIDLST
jgi:hypothetical protein